MSGMPGPPPSRAATRRGLWSSTRPASVTSLPAVGSEPPLDDAALGRRAQLLATEHWGLLAARSTAQSELLTRITIFLTLVSAGLVTIGLLGQATGFSAWFGSAAIAILAFLALIGVMTHIRVFNASEEDMMYVIAMNRIRGAYVEIDPGVAGYFLAGIHDDPAGARQTYSFLRPRSFSHLVGSSIFLVSVVVSCVFGLMAGAIATLAGTSTGWVVAIGVTVGVLYLAGMIAYGSRVYIATWRTYRPLRPSTDGAR